MVLRKGNWQEKLKDKTFTEMVNTLNKECNRKVMTRRDGNQGNTCPGDGSSIKILWQVRNVFRQKKKAFEGRKTVTSVRKCLAMRAVIENEEDDLASLYIERKGKLEASVMNKIKRNPFFFMPKDFKNI